MTRYAVTLTVNTACAQLALPPRCSLIRSGEPSVDRWPSGVGTDLAQPLHTAHSLVEALKGLSNTQAMHLTGDAWKDWPCLLDSGPDM